VKYNYRCSILSVQQNLAELTKLRNAFQASKNCSENKPADNRGYQLIAGYHGIPGFHCWHHLESTRTTLHGRFFLPWHRAYLHDLETKLRDITRDPSITIPYWDWRFPEIEQGKEIDKENYDEASELPKSYAEQTYDNDKPNPLFNSKISILNPPIITTRQRNKRLNRPTKEDIDRILKISNFDEFEYQVESVHDQIHGFVGGSMSMVNQAAFDPIFWAHHSMIDRIWYVWQISCVGGINKGFEQLINASLAPFDVNVGQVLDIRNLGYMYAGDKATVSGKSEGGNFKTVR
jgi:tyrosinase